jgi:predicted nucleotidyltransferase/HEPN domain-containing protein
MRTSLDHLPQRTQERLAFIVQVLRETGPVEMVVLFGSHARGTWANDLATGFKSDFDVLVVTRSAEVADDVALWGKATARFAGMPEGWPDVDLVVHDFAFVNDQIKQGQYFWRDVVTEGVLLYTSGAFAFNTKYAPTPEQRRAQAERDFERFHTSASRFFQMYEDGLARGWLNESAFELHQATERFFAAFLLTFTAYMLKSHNLEKLANMAAQHHPDMRPLLPRKEPEDERLFELLKKAYVDARYSTKYRVTAEELGVLGARVKALGEVVERVCREKIAALG